MRNPIYESDMLNSRYKKLANIKGRQEKSETRLCSIKEELQEAGLPENFYSIKFDDQIKFYA